MTRAGWLLPGLLAGLPWVLLHAVGARAHVVVITGTITSPLEALLGLGYVAAWLLAVLVAPPLLATGALIASGVARSGRSPATPRPPAAGRAAGASGTR